MRNLITKRTLLGVLTPSSNTILEPLTSAMVSGLDHVSAHFGRFGVTEISLGQESTQQFNLDNILNAAALLADAHVNSIVWSGTSASWLGIETDRALCQAIKQRTGIPAGSSVLAVNELFEKSGVKRFGLVTPYVGEIQEQIIANYASAGYECVAERHLGETRNFNFSEFTEETIADLILAVADQDPDAITIMCTNMRGARIAAELEQRTGIPIYDSTAAAVWAALHIAGEDPAQIKGWGQMFDLR